MVVRSCMQEVLTEENLIKVEGWARNGLTQEQIAHNLGISGSALKNWIKKSEPLKTAIKKGKEVSDLIIENAIFKRALGYSYEEITHERVGGEMVETKRIVKYLPPDTTAQIFWLKNRKPADWRDVKNNNISLDEKTIKTVKEISLTDKLEYITKAGLALGGDDIGGKDADKDNEENDGNEE